MATTIVDINLHHQLSSTDTVDINLILPNETKSSSDLRTRTHPTQCTTSATTPPTLRSQSSPLETPTTTNKFSSLRQPSAASRFVTTLRQVSGLARPSGSSEEARISFHTETALCPICYCQETMDQMYTVSDACRHRFCKECLSGWINCLVTDGKVTQLACPFDAAMVTEEEKKRLTNWNCGTCTMMNPKKNHTCCACNVRKDQWQCKTCTFYNTRPLTSTVGTVDIEIETGSETKTNESIPVAVLDVICTMCNTASQQTPPPSHPAFQDKCGVMMTKTDVQALCTEEVVNKFERFTAMQADPNNRDCPNPIKCEHRQLGSPNQPEMICEKCQYVYCFEHSSAHLNQTCSWYQNKIKKEVALTKAAVRKLGTRPCPHCKLDTIKASGCNHMTCSKCHGEWCWLCSRGINGNVAWHFDPRNITGCGGMQMNYNATSGLVPTIVRRLMYIPTVLIGGIFAFCVGICALIVNIGLFCSCILPVLAGLASRVCEEPVTEMIFRGGVVFGLMIAFVPMIAFLSLCLAFAVGLEVGLLPIWIGLSINECLRGRSGSKMLFLPIVIQLEIVTMFINS